MKVRLTDGVDVTFAEFDVEFTEGGTLLNGEGDDDGFVFIEVDGQAIGSLWFNAPVGPSDESDRISESEVILSGFDERGDWDESARVGLIGDADGIGTIRQ